LKCQFAIDALIIEINSERSKTTAHMASDTFLEEHIDIWLFTSASINISFLWNGKQYSTWNFPKGSKDIVLSEQWSLTMDHINEGHCPLGYICHTDELLSWLALGSAATRARTTRKGSQDNSIVKGA